MFSDKVNQYIEKQVEVMGNLFPDAEPEYLRELITEIVEERDIGKDIKEFSIEIPADPEKGKPATVIDNISLDKLEKKLEKDKPILTRFGCCYYRQSQKLSILAQLLAYLFSYRKKIKGQMFEHINDVDQTEYQKLDMIQRTIKILMNSFYGVLIANGSIFYSPDCGASITYNGKMIIQTAISIFERSLTNNIRFFSVDDVIDYCQTIIDEEHYERKDCIVAYEYIELDDLIDYLEKHYFVNVNNSYKRCKFNDVERKLLELYLTNIIKNNEEYYSYIYYKNNFDAFVNDTIIAFDAEGENCKDFKDYFNDIFTTEFHDPNKPNKEQMETLDFIWDILKEYVFYDYQNFYKAEECLIGTRKAVTGVDTDSNMIHLGRKYEYFLDLCELEDTQEVVYSVCNTLTNLITRIINKTYLTLTEACNIDEEYRSLINMKSEFLWAKVMFTKNKKNYVNIAILQEGNIIENPKIEIKGLPIKKVSVNKNVRDYFTEILQNDIMNTENIDYPKIINKYFVLANRIEESIKTGSTEYALPEKANEPQTYKDPFSQMCIRGSILWNSLFPDEEITFPSKLNKFKLNIPNNEEIFEEILNNYLEGKKYNEEEYESFIENMKEVFNNERLFKKDIINVICFPKTVKVLPIFLRPFIDLDSMVQTHLSSGTIVLDSLDIQTPKINENLVPSNIIKI